MKRNVITELTFGTKGTLLRHYEYAVKCHHRRLGIGQVKRKSTLELHQKSELSRMLLPPSAAEITTTDRPNYY